MVLWQPELSFHRTMALDARSWVLSGINDEPGTSASRSDMETSGAMTGLAARLARRSRILKVYFCMGAAWEIATDIGVAFRTGPLAYKMRSRNVWGGCQAQRGGCTGNKYQSYARSQTQNSSGGQVSVRFYDRRLASHRLCEERQPGSVPQNLW